MSEFKKLTEEELADLKKITKEALELASALGELEFQKTVLENQSNFYKSKVVSLKTTETLLLETLQNKYGKISINLETGEFS